MMSCIAAVIQPALAKEAAPQRLGPQPPTGKPRKVRLQKRAMSAPPQPTRCEAGHPQDATNLPLHLRDEGGQWTPVCRACRREASRAWTAELAAQPCTTCRRPLLGAVLETSRRIGHEILCEQCWRGCDTLKASYGRRESVPRHPAVYS